MTSAFVVAPWLEPEPATPVVAMSGVPPERSRGVDRAKTLDEEEGKVPDAFFFLERFFRGMSAVRVSITSSTRVEKEGEGMRIGKTATMLMVTMVPTPRQWPSRPRPNNYSPRAYMISENTCYS